MPEVPAAPQFQPLREKYIEARWPRWFVFGVYLASNLVDVYDGDKDVANRVTRDTAARLIAERNKVVDELIRLYQAHPEEFDRLPVVAVKGPT